MRIRRDDPLGDFNTEGQEKCWFCSTYFPEAWVHTHAAKCSSNPDNQEQDDD